MALTATLRHNSTSVASGASYTTGSFSPSANGLLVVVAGVGVQTNASAPGAVTVTDSFVGTGAWSSVQLGATYWRIVIAWAQLGASPGSGAVTLTPTYNNSNRWIVHAYDVAGHNVSAPVTQSKTNNTLTTSTYSLSLDSAPATDSLLLGGLYLRAESDGSVTAGAGFTAQNDFNGTAAGGNLLNSAYDATSPPQSISWSNIAASITELAAAAIEIAAAGGGGGGGVPRHFMHYQKLRSA